MMSSSSWRAYIVRRMTFEIVKTAARTRIAPRNTHEPHGGGQALDPEQVVFDVFDPGRLPERVHEALRVHGGVARGLERDLQRGRERILPEVLRQRAHLAEQGA